MKNFLLLILGVSAQYEHEDVMEDPNNRNGQTAIDYVVKKSDWY